MILSVSSLRYIFTEQYKKTKGVDYSTPFVVIVSVGVDGFEPPTLCL